MGFWMFTFHDDGAYRDGRGYWGSVCEGSDGADNDQVSRPCLASEENAELNIRFRSLPYIFRFRQCMSEVLTGSTPTPRKSLMNAAKYASAFPVIVFSAMQTVIGDPFDEEVLGAGDELRWIGRSALFKLWSVVSSQSRP